MPLEPGANPGICVKDRRDAVLFAVQKRGKYGVQIIRATEKTNWCLWAPVTRIFGKQKSASVSLKGSFSPTP
nr:MAG TPA: hypothetical protein [Caudoviricetes sp.]